MSAIALQLKYQPPGAAEPVDRLYAVDQATLDRALAVLNGTDEKPEEPLALPGPAAGFIELISELQAGLATLREQIDGVTSAIDPSNPALPAAKLSDLRAVGSGPKQIAALLECESGFFDAGDETMCLFSPVRFTPTKGFFDMRQG